MQSKTSGVADFSDLEISLAAAIFEVADHEMVSRPHCEHARRALKHLKKVDPTSGGEAEYLRLIAELEAVGDTIPYHRELAARAAGAIKELLGGVKQYFRLLRMSQQEVDRLLDQMDRR